MHGFNPPTTKTPTIDALAMGGVRLSKYVVRQTTRVPLAARLFTYLYLCTSSVRNSRIPTEHMSPIYYRKKKTKQNT